MTGRKGQVAAGILAAAGTLLLHALFAVAVWGGGGRMLHPDRPEAIGSGANRGTAEGDSVERRIVVRMLSDVNARPLPSAPDAYLTKLVEAALKVEITGPDALSLPPLMVSDGGPVADSSDAELMARAKMLGIYESQTRARIERAWQLPKGQSEEVFSCRALIRQRRDGRVVEVELPYDGCGGSPQMRQSLINAIFSASPLPAPPHPSVFVESFSMLLRSESVRRR